MKKIILFLLIFISFEILQAKNPQIVITTDSLFIQLKKRRIDIIEIEFEIINNSNEYLYINKEIGVITETPPLQEDEIKKICEEYNLNGQYNIVIYNDSGQIISDFPFLSVGDLVYFNKKGNLKYEYLEGIESVKKVKRKLNKYAKAKANPIILSIGPYEKEVVKLKIYLGNYLFEKDQIYYLQLNYNNRTNNELSRVHCIKSNKLKLIIK